MNNSDKIELALPFKAEYVSIARLAASGIANRMGFDFETIEDIKVAVAEVCNRFVNKRSANTESYRIIFVVDGSILEIAFQCEDKGLKCIFDESDDGLGVSIINALMDGVEFCNEGPNLLTMSKSIEGII